MKEALRAQRSAARTAERIFAQVDIDASGDVTYDEFTAWWKARSEAATGAVDEEALAEGLKIFEKFDDDQSGAWRRRSQIAFLLLLFASPILHSHQLSQPSSMPILLLRSDAGI